MPKLDLLTQSDDEKAAAQVMYGLLKAVSECSFVNQTPITCTLKRKSGLAEGAG
jgi:hypothetical protein